MPRKEDGNMVVRLTVPQGATGGQTLLMNVQVRAATRRAARARARSAGVPSAEPPPPPPRLGTATPGAGTLGSAT
eukprot:5190216-Prymnesium_polylepis.1